MASQEAQRRRDEEQGLEGTQAPEGEDEATLARLADEEDGAVWSLDDDEAAIISSEALSEDPDDDGGGYRVSFDGYGYPSLDDQEPAVEVDSLEPWSPDR